MEEDKSANDPGKMSASGDGPATTKTGKPQKSRPDTTDTQNAKPEKNDEIEKRTPATSAPSSVTAPTESGKPADPAPSPEASKSPESGAGTSEGPGKEVPEARSADGSASTQPKPSPKQAGAAPLKKKRPLISALLILLLLASLAGGGWLAWRFLPQAGTASVPPRAEQPQPQPAPVAAPPPAVDDSWRQPLSELESRIATLAEDYRQLASQNRGASAEVRDRLADIQLQLNSYGERIRALSTTTREDWLLAEAEYLLRLANQRLLTERQTANALALMETADVILRDLDDPGLFPVRKALADDITALRMTGVVDREGIYLRLDALIGAVEKLEPILDLERPQASPAVAAAEQEALSWPRQLLDNARSAFAGMINLVRIQRRDLPLEPLLSVEQQMNLRYNLRVALEQAQLSLLREEAVIYRSALGRAKEWLQRYFKDNAATRAVLQELQSLEQMQVVQPLPSAFASLSALHDYIKLWHNRYPVEDGESSR